ncbi:hypothetical protein N9081_05025 [Akkermansiaceae bacterium]|nr:hypothetical protein [Akkermansiaceae bacterium]MDB4791575.1 hypothetical protein [Akkermansiaceae bacterium]
MSIQGDLTKELTEQWANSIDDVAAAILANLDQQHFFPLLDLSGLNELSDAAAESLSKHKGDLVLSGLTEVSDAAVESLSKHEGELYLGLRKLSDAAAESLSKHKGYLHLEFLDELSDAAAESLSKHQEGLSLNDRIELSAAGGNRSLSIGESWPMSSESPQCFPNKPTQLSLNPVSLIVDHD